MNIIAVILLWISTAPTGQGFSIQQGKHFRLICHFKNEAAAREALETVEAVWPLGADLYSLPGGRLDALLKVHLYRTVDDYELTEAELTGGRFRRNLAFALHATRSAHVAVQPPLSDEALERIGLPQQTLRLLAHEAAHLVRYTGAPNFRSHPGWLTDGAAMWISGKVLSDLGRSKGLEASPSEGKYLVRAGALLREGRLPKAAEILGDRIDDLSFYDRYAVRALLFRFLGSSRYIGKRSAMVKLATGLEEGDAYRAGLEEGLGRILGPKGHEELDEELTRFLRAGEPEWDEVYRMLDTSGDPWVQIAFPKTNALAWSLVEKVSPGCIVSGVLEILPGEGKQLNLLLGRKPNGFLSVAFTAGYGCTVLDYRNDRESGEAWNRLGAAPTGLVALNTKIPFRVTVEKNNLKVEIRESHRGAWKEVLGVSLEGLDAAGPVGVGAQAGTAGRWSSLEVRSGGG